MQVAREDSNRYKGITPGCVVEYEGEQFHVMAAWESMLRIVKRSPAEFDAADTDSEPVDWDEGGKIVRADVVRLVSSDDALEVEIVEELPTEGRFWREEIEFDDLARRRMQRFMPVLRDK